MGIFLCNRGGSPWRKFKVYFLGHFVSPVACPNLGRGCDFSDIPSCLDLGLACSVKTGADPLLDIETPRVTIKSRIIDRKDGLFVSPGL